MNGTEPERTSGIVRSLLSHLAQPTDDWAYRSDEHRPSVLLTLMCVLLGLLIMVAIAAIGIASGFNHQAMFIAELVLLGVAAAIVAVLMYQVRQHLLAPLAQLYGWAVQMCDGDFSARIVPPREGRFVKLTFHVNRLSEALDRLANQMDDMVWEQTERLHDKNQSLELLYDIVAAMHGSDATSEVLMSATRRLMSLTTTNRAVVHVVADDGSFILVTNIGFVEEHGGALEPIDREMIPTTVKVHPDRKQNEKHIAVPLIYQNQPLGLIRLGGLSVDQSLDEETSKLLENVGQHLGMVIAKASLDEKARDLALVNERTALAHELHDSLAQTIAALRFQVNNLDDSMLRADPLASKRDLRKINAGIDAVNTEVRDLIANFRAPIDERGLLTSIEDVVSRFERDSAMAVYLHTEGEVPVLTPVAETQFLGIVREGLANARKHSGAKLVRILLQSKPDGYYRLLIEDDGVGFDQPADEAQPGEHVGLSIMRDRAERLGCQLRIESDPGEGTRLDLTFDIDTPVSESLARVN